MMHPVRLEPYECQMAAFAGMQRQTSCLNTPDSHGFVGDEGQGWNIHIEGAGGEIALAKALGMYWSGSVNTFKVGGDVGELQVRTRSQHYYDLILRPDDRDDDLFALVTGLMPNYLVRGWTYARDAKRSEFVQKYGGRPAAWFVPTHFLRPFKKLVR